MRLLQQALTFDDILLVPAHSNVLPREVSLKTQLTRNIQLNICLLYTSHSLLHLVQWLESFGLSPQDC